MIESDQSDDDIQPKFGSNSASHSSPHSSLRIAQQGVGRKLNSLTGNFERRQQIVIFSDTNVSHFRSLGSLPTQGRGTKWMIPPEGALLGLLPVFSSTIIVQM